MEPEPRSNQRLRAYFRPVRIPNFLDRVDHVSLRHSAAWFGFICRHNRRSIAPVERREFCLKRCVEDGRVSRQQGREHGVRRRGGRQLAVSVHWCAGDRDQRVLASWWDAASIPFTASYIAISTMA